MTVCAVSENQLAGGGLVRPKAPKIVIYDSRLTLNILVREVYIGITDYDWFNLHASTLDFRTEI